MPHFVSGAVGSVGPYVETGSLRWMPMPRLPTAITGTSPVVVARVVSSVGTHAALPVPAYQTSSALRVLRQVQSQILSRYRLAEDAAGPVSANDVSATGWVVSM